MKRRTVWFDRQHAFDQLGSCIRYQPARLDERHGWRPGEHRRFGPAASTADKADSIP
jgi:hypothetical protein